MNDIYSAAEREREREEIRKREKAVESYLSRLIPAPLVQRQEVSQVGNQEKSENAIYFFTSSRFQLKKERKIGRFSKPLLLLDGSVYEHG